MNRFQLLNEFSAVIEQKKILTLCLKEENTDSTLLLSERIDAQTLNPDFSELPSTMMLYQ